MTHEILFFSLCCYHTIDKFSSMKTLFLLIAIIALVGANSIVTSVFFCQGNTVIDTCEYTTPTGDSNVTTTAELGSCTPVLSNPCDPSSSIAGYVLIDSINFLYFNYS